MKATFLSRFTPSLMAPEALEAIFVKRHALADQMVQRIRDAALTPSKSHMLLIGPRGIGKTHLIALVYHRVQAMDDLRNHLLIAWLREEEWGVTSFLDLLLRIFRALQTEYHDAALAERVEALYNLPPDAAERAAAALLKEFSGDRTLLILAENLDDMFDGLGDDGQKRLRAYLQEQPFCTIVATAQGLFNGVSLQTSPFYGFFRIRHLEGLDFEEAVRLLANIAAYEGDQELAPFIQTPLGRARIRAIHHIAGGSFRVYVIFSQFLTRQALDELVEPFMHTLDDLTPYYQSRMAWLSPQQRKIVEFLCDRRHAVTVKEIAQRCFITHQTASSQLKDLREKGYVHAITVGRESYYELHEPLMRFCIEVKKQRGEPIRLFVDFLRLWYSRTELEQRLASLEPDAVLEREYVLHALRTTDEEDEDPRVAACLKDYNAYIKRSDFKHALEVAEELVALRGHTPDWFERGYCLDRLGRYDDALASFDKMIELNPNDAWAWEFRGGTLDSLGRLDEALASYDKAIELDPNFQWAWYDRGKVLDLLEHYEEAVASFDKAIELDPNAAWTWYRRGMTLGGLGRYEEAVASFDKAIELDPNAAEAWYGQGMALVDLGRYDDALTSFDNAIERGNRSSQVFFKRAEAILALNRWEEGMSALDDALQRLAQANTPEVGDTTAIIRNLFGSTHDAAIWRTRIATLIELYDKHQVLSALGQGLVHGIAALASPMISDTAARLWRDVWQELAGDRQEFALPLGLLDAAVRYRETHDQRVLLELPIEERGLLEPLLGIEEPSKP
jgi:tetratricopeptide (TPR) repeat protein